MSRPRRLLAGLTCAATCSAAPGHAQPAAPPSAPETLETPYEDAPAAPLPPATATSARPAAASSAPAVSPPAVAGPVAPVPRADIRPIRARRRLALTGEIGWNGLAGFGPVLTYHVNPHFSMDLGGGASAFGWKAGLRGRYNFMSTPFTPFLGVGFNATSGLGEITVNPDDRTRDANGELTDSPITLNVKPSYLFQAVLGFDFIHKRGFTLVGCVGSATLLNSNNVEVLAGSLKDDEQQAIKAFFKSGPVISVAAGYAFQ